MTDIEKLKKLEAKATKGPWETDDTESDGEFGNAVRHHPSVRDAFAPIPPAREKP